MFLSNFLNDFHCPVSYFTVKLWNGQWVILGPFLELFSNGHFNITVLACPDISPPSGSYILNGTLTSRTFLCELGTVFPDSKERTRILECRNGKWNESVVAIPNCTGENHFFFIIIYFFLSNSALAVNSNGAFNARSSKNFFSNFFQEQISFNTKITILSR